MLDFLLVCGSGLVGVGVGYLLRGQQELSIRKREALRRKNALLDRGRVTSRRPEHDGEPPSRVHKLHIRNERPRLPGK